MQVAPLHAHVSVDARRAYPLAARAASVCSPVFLAHLAVWREALAAQSPMGEVPRTYLDAMRGVVALEAQAGTVDEEDALAAAIAMAGLGTPASQQAASGLLQDLMALGHERAGLLDAALTIVNGNRASRARCRMTLLALRHSTGASVATAALCLLGDSYLASPGEDGSEQTAYRFYLAASRSSSSAAAPAHLQLGNWYQAQGTCESLMQAASHYHSGAELGCSLCLRALGRSPGWTDPAFSEDAGELADLMEHALSARATPKVRPAAAGQSSGRTKRDGRESFIDSVRGLLRGAFA